jgi:hypothetical protein
VSAAAAIPDLDRRRDAELRRWTGRAAVLIWDRLADAAAHARGDNMLAAHERLNELRAGLTGGQPQGALLGNARAAFYRQAFHHHPHDPALHSEPPLRPEPAGEMTARIAEILGRNQYRDLRDLINETGQSLDRTAAVSTELLPAWEVRERERLISAVTAALSDAQIALSEAVSHIRIKPELR